MSTINPKRRKPAPVAKTDAEERLCKAAVVWLALRESDYGPCNPKDHEVIFDSDTALRDAARALRAERAAKCKEKP